MGIPIFSSFSLSLFVSINFTVTPKPFYFNFSADNTYIHPFDKQDVAVSLHLCLKLTKQNGLPVFMINQALEIAVFAISLPLSLIYRT